MNEITIPERIEYIATTFDNEEFIFSEEDYRLYKQALDLGIKVIHFKNMSMTVADIRRVVEQVRPESKSYQFDEED